MAYPHHFYFWCQHVLPLVYDDSLSYYEVLCKITDYINNMLKDINSLTDITNQLRIDVDTLQKEWPEFQDSINQDITAFKQEIESELQEMQDTLDAIKNGEYVNLYLDSIKSYIDNNLQNLVAGIVKYVTFGLTTDGHFVAYIPPAWQFLQFGTISDPESELYNHLTLQW